MKNAYNGFISRLDTVEERIHEHEDKSTEVTQAENKVKNARGGKNQIEHPRHVGQYEMAKHSCNWNSQRRKKKEWGRKNNGQEFSKISDRHQTTCPRCSSSENT